MIPITENAVQLSRICGYQIADSVLRQESATRASTDLRGFRQREWAGFAQDTWKLASNFTPTYGFRWEYYGVPFEAHNNFPDFHRSQRTRAVHVPLVGPGTRHTLYNNQYDNFEPRVGFAWDVLKDGKTSCGWLRDISRSAFGNLIGNTRANPPFALTAFNNPESSSFAGHAAQPPSVPTILTWCQMAQLVREPQSILLEDAVQPELEFWCSACDHTNADPGSELCRGERNGYFPRRRRKSSADPTSFHNSWRIARSRQCLRLRTATLQFSQLSGMAHENGSLPFDAVKQQRLLYRRRRQPGAFVYKSIGNSIYNGMQVNLQQHFTHGFQLQFAYTYSHAIDNVNDPLVPAMGNGNLPRNSFDLKAERGNSDFDIRHRAVINFIYEAEYRSRPRSLNDGFAGRAFEGWSCPESSPPKPAIRMTFSE